MKVFISQPMSGLSDKDVLKEREHMIEVFKNKFKDKEDIEFITSFFEVDENPELVNNSKQPALYYLGRSLQMMADADIVLFANGWGRARGCIMEHMAADFYNINKYFMNDLELNG